MMFKGVKVIYRETGWIVEGKVIVKQNRDNYSVFSRTKMTDAQILKALDDFEDAKFTKELLDICKGRD